VCGSPPSPRCNPQFSLVPCQPASGFPHCPPVLPHDMVSPPHRTFFRSNLSFLRFFLSFRSNSYFTGVYCWVHSSLEFSVVVILVNFLPRSLHSSVNLGLAFDSLSRLGRTCVPAQFTGPAPIYNLIRFHFRLRDSLVIVQITTVSHSSNFFLAVLPVIHRYAAHFPPFSCHLACLSMLSFFFSFRKAFLSGYYPHYFPPHFFLSALSPRLPGSFGHGFHFSRPFPCRILLALVSMKPSPSRFFRPPPSFTRFE